MYNLEVFLIHIYQNLIPIIIYKNCASANILFYLMIAYILYLKYDI